MLLPAKSSRAWNVKSNAISVDSDEDVLAKVRLARNNDLGPSETL